MFWFEIIWKNVVFGKKISTNNKENIFTDKIIHFNFLKKEFFLLYITIVLLSLQIIKVI